MKNIGWFAGCDKEAFDLFEGVLEAIRDGRLNAKISWVFCNTSSEKVLAELRKIIGTDDIAVIFCDSKVFKAEIKKTNSGASWRELYDKEVLRLLQCCLKPDIVMLVGYMLVVTSILHDHFDMWNLHPALPGGPKGMVDAVTQEVVDLGLEETGTMIHGVTGVVDDPRFVISYCRVDIRDCSGPQEVREEQYRQEGPLVGLTLEGIANGTIRMGDEAVDLTESVVKMTNI